MRLIHCYPPIYASDSTVVCSANFLYAFVICIMHTKCFTRVILICLITLIILCEEYMLLNFSLWFLISFSLTLRSYSQCSILSYPLLYFYLNILYGSNFHSQETVSIVLWFFVDITSCVCVCVSVCVCVCVCLSVCLSVCLQDRMTLITGRPSSTPSPP
jgi:hypothetical protein